MQFYDPLSSDCVREFEGLLVLLLVGPCLFRHKVEVQPLVASSAVYVNVEVERDVPGREFALAQPDWFFRFLHVIIGCFCYFCYSFPFKSQNNNKKSRNKKEWFRKVRIFSVCLLL